MNFVRTSINSTLFSSNYCLRVLSINNLAIRDAFMDKFDTGVSEDSKLRLRYAPLNTQTLFAGEVQPALCRLESNKQSNKTFNVKWHIPRANKTRCLLFVSPRLHPKAEDKTKVRSPLVETEAETLNTETWTTKGPAETEDIDSQI